MDFAEVEVDYKFHSHIIGKNGANGKIFFSNFTSYFHELV